MRKLYHYPLNAESRAIRIILAEKHLDYELIYEVPWEPTDALFEYSPTGLLPVFIDLNGTAIYGASSIREYLDEAYPETKLIPGDVEQKAEARKIADWFCTEFSLNVYSLIIDEKIYKRFSRTQSKTPNPYNILKALSNFYLHMEYISWLAERRNWLAGKQFSIADIYAASYISVMDYLDCISWNKHELAKEWYAKIKSRPSFRKILQDKVSQISPAKDFANLDF